MHFKSNQQEVKDLDESKGVVVAYANAYDVVDSDDDISAQGSFVKTIQENAKRIRVLKDHNSTISLGVPLEIDANDSFGLKTVSQFNMKKEVARDMFTDIKLYMENGLNAELSIGYEIIKRDENDSRIIKEYKLYEYSFLTSWAANQMSTVQGLKNLSNHYGILDLITKAYDMDYSDLRLKEIEQLLISLTEEPSPHSEVKADDIDAVFDKYNQSLKIEELFNGTN